MPNLNTLTVVCCHFRLPLNILFNCEYAYNYEDLWDDTHEINTKIKLTERLGKGEREGGMKGGSEAHMQTLTRSSADADNRRDAFSGQSRSTNTVPFHILGIVSYCTIVTFSSRRALFTIYDFNKCRDHEIGVRGHSMSLKVATFDRLCMVSY